MTEIYSVQKGDNLYTIAKRNGINVKELLKLNPEFKKNPKLIFAGQKIKLPPKSADDIDMNIKGLSVEKTVPNALKPVAQNTPQEMKFQPQEGFKPSFNLDNTPQQPVDEQKKPAVEQKVAVKQSPETKSVEKQPNTPQVPKALAQEQLNETTKQPDANVDTSGYEQTLYIIETDTKGSKFNSEKIAKQIANAANKADIQPDSLAAIVKNESHFITRTSEHKKAAKNPAGITSIVPKDMYARPGIYDSQINTLIKQYGSLDKLFKAKDKNPNLKLGNFGDMLYEYKNAENLDKARKQDYDLNLLVGAFSFKYKLKEANGNERKAFENYNTVNTPVTKNGKVVLKSDGTPLKLKESYANTAMKSISQARKNFKPAPKKPETLPTQNLAESTKNIGSFTNNWGNLLNPEFNIKPS